MLKIDPMFKNPQLHKLFWILIAAIILIGDFYSGPYIQFPILYLIPITLSAWFSGKWWGIAFAVCLSLIRFYYTTIWDIHYTLFESGINTAIRIIVFSAFVCLLDRIARQKHELEKEVNILEGILPICSFCKKIRNADGTWEVLESYISDHSEAHFTHGFCPDCAREHYGQFLKK